LLIFGGVSTLQGDVPLLHDVIAKARAANPNIEIVLTSRMAGDRNQTEYNPFLNPALAQPVDPNGTDYRSDLYRLAAAEHVQFWDLTTPWSQYLLNSGLASDGFYRDLIHMNGLGDMLAARIMESFFTPVASADFSNDGQVNGADLAFWTPNVGMPAPVFRAQGDANEDGRIDGADFLIWQRQSAPGSVNAVPEPATLSLVICLITAAGIKKAINYGRLAC
jgi:hypothetical protein